MPPSENIPAAPNSYTLYPLEGSDRKFTLSELLKLHVRAGVISRAEFRKTIGLDKNNEK